MQWLSPPHWKAEDNRRWNGAIFAVTGRERWARRCPPANTVQEGHREKENQRLELYLWYVAQRMRVYAKTATVRERAITARLLGKMVQMFTQRIILKEHQMLWN